MGKSFFYFSLKAKHSLKSSSLLALDFFPNNLNTIVFVSEYLKRKKAGKKKLQCCVSLIIASEIQLQFAAPGTQLTQLTLLKSPWVSEIALKKEHQVLTINC